MKHFMEETSYFRDVSVGRFFNRLNMVGTMEEKVVLCLSIN